MGHLVSKDNMTMNIRHGVLQIVILLFYGWFVTSCHSTISEVATPQSLPDSTPTATPTATPTPAPGYQSQIDTTSGLIGYWKMDGDWDDSVANHHATANGATLTTGQIGAGAGSFLNGNSASIPYSSDFDLDQFSIELSFQADSIPGSYTTIIARNDNEYGIWIHPSGAIECSGDYFYLPSSTTLSLGSWHHIVCVIDRTAGITLYVDGVLDNSVVDTWTWAFQPVTINIGTDSFGDPGLNGTIDEISFYNLLLTEEQVSAHYTAWAAEFP